MVTGTAKRIYLTNEEYKAIDEMLRDYVAEHQTGMSSALKSAILELHINAENVNVTLDKWGIITAIL